MLESERQQIFDESKADQVTSKTTGWEQVLKRTNDVASHIAQEAR